MDTDRPFTTNPATVSPRIAADHDRLVQSLYESVLEPERWHQTLEELRASLNASAINLFGLEMAAFDNSIVHISSNPDDFGKRHGDHGYCHDIQGQGAAAQGLMTGGISAAERMPVDRREFIASQFFNDCLRGLGVQDVACTSLWDDEPGMPRIVLSFFRGLGARGFEREEHERLNSLGQHLNRAFKIAWKLGKLSRVQEWHRSVMDGLRQAALVLDGHQKILHANPEGGILLGKSDGLLQVRHGRLVGLGSQVSMSLAEAFACADRGIPAHIVYRLERKNARPVIGTARILPLGEAPILGVPVLHVRYLLLVEPPNTPVLDALATFGQFYRLTRTELAVLAQLLTDATVEDIAAILDIGLPTVRTHVLHLRRKPGTRGLNELVGLAMNAVCP